MKKQDILDKQLSYQGKILDALQSLFEEDSDNYIGIEELTKGENLTHFIHVLANTAPNSVYRKLTGKETNNLQFNHVANILCFQYGDREDKS